MKKELFKTIVSDIKSDEFFKDYKFVRSENTFLLRNGGEFVGVDLEHWRDYYDEALVIRPMYGKHFDVLSKWYEKFSKRDVKYLRLDFHVTVDNETYGREREIEIKYDFSDYDVVVPQFISMMKEHLTSVDREYATLNDYYRKVVLPRIVGDKKFPEVGADWMFEYLTATYLLDQENYPKLKKQIKKEADWLVNHHEINVAEYYDELDFLISYLEDNVKL